MFRSSPKERLTKGTTGLLPCVVSEPEYPHFKFGTLHCHRSQPLPAPTCESSHKDGRAQAKGKACLIREALPILFFRSTGPRGVLRAAETPVHTRRVPRYQ